MFYDFQIKQISSTAFFHLYDKMLSGSFSKRTELQGHMSGEQVVVGGDQCLLFQGIETAQTMAWASSLSSLRAFQ